MYDVSICKKRLAVPNCWNGVRYHGATIKTKSTHRRGLACQLFASDNQGSTALLYYCTLMPRRPTVG